MLKKCCFLALSLLGLGEVLAGQAVPALPPHLRFVDDFEGGLHGRQGAANPFLAAGNVKLVDAGAGQGRALRFVGQDEWPDGRTRMAWEKSAAIMAGANLPHERGVVAVRVRFSGARQWGDAKRTWLLVLAPEVASGLLLPRVQATGLAVVKDADNALALCVYQFYDSRLNHYFQSAKSGASAAEPDAVPLRLPAGDLPAGDWVRVRGGWDRAAGKVWLGLNDRLACADVSFRPGPWHVLFVGTPPGIDERSTARGFDGDVDDLIVDARTPGDAALAGYELPTPLPPVAQTTVALPDAVHLKGDPEGEKVERMVRAHFDMVLRCQRPNGGWAFSVAWPSGLCFMSTKVVVPIGRAGFNGSKDANSAWVACQLLAAYHALGDAKYLEAAERTGRALVRMQRPAGGWNYGASYRESTDEYEPVYADDKLPFEDHVQAHPVALLFALGRLTGKPEYTAAAQRAVAFIARGQNPNGSWSHHYNTVKGCGETRNGQAGGGEINDDTTADQMTVMFLAYRMTGEPQYLARYLSAADWIVNAFIDGKAKGWAQQYDLANQPVPARHFEPAAISLSEGIETAPIELLRAYRLTGDRRYLAPVLKWREWMWANRVFTNAEKTAWAWYPYYDPADGQAFRYLDRQRLPPDPRELAEGGYTAVLRAIEQAEQPVPRLPLTPTRAQALIKADELTAAGPEKFRPSVLFATFNWEAGTWVGGESRPSGPVVQPQSIRGTLLCRTLFLRRQLRGQIPWTHPRAAYEREEWANPFLMVLTPEELYKPLSAEEVTRARAAAVATPPGG